MTETTTAATATGTARSGTYVCANPLCGSVASYPGTCCGQPMTARGGRR